MSAPASSSTGLPEGARVVLATHNAGKVRELRQLLAGAVPGLDVETAVVDAGAVGAPDVVEDGVTFAQNALKKARAVAAHTGLIAVADDSGLAVDVLHGEVTGLVDDLVLRRNDGAYAYNLAVVVDDLAQGVDQVVRGDDLLDSAPRQRWLAEALCSARGEPTPAVEYLHVPLVLNAEGRRLAKRDGAVTLEDLAAQDPAWTPERVRDRLLESLGLPAGPLAAAVPAFDPAALPRDPWVFTGL